MTDRRLGKSLQMGISTNAGALPCGAAPAKREDLQSECLTQLAFLESAIERVPADKRLSRKLNELHELACGGWSVSALLAPDSKTVVLLACRGGVA